MTTRDFFYWLQGYFELTGTDEVKPGHAECILRHTDLVLEVDKAAPQTVGAIRALCKLIVAGVTDARVERLICEIVEGHFEHVIDPQAGGQEAQDLLNAIHSARERAKPAMRC